MLAASLTVENKRQPINNINDLRKQLNPDDPKHISFGFKGGGTTEAFFAESQIGMALWGWLVNHRVKLKDHYNIKKQWF